MSSPIDFDGLIGEIGKCCLDCPQCEKKECLIGYCKEMLLVALKQGNEFIADGLDGLPLNDTKVYQEEIIVDFIGYVLNQCRNCNVYHDEECILNIIRSALEVILFGDARDYRGSTVRYLRAITRVNPELTEKISKAFQERKEQEV